jgi:hypothetical protein
MTDYRRAILVSLVYWVEGYPLFDRNDARSVALFEGWADRLAAAADDLSLEGVLQP